MNGIIIIDKPSGVTSFDVVRRIRRICGEKRVGHGGTLDPLATGILPILLGSATKLFDKIMGSEKEYVAEIKFGEATDTDDSEGGVIETKPVPEDLGSRLEVILNSFVGKIQQAAPRYSAIKQAGRPLYKMARNNEDFTPPVRDVVIKEIELMSYKQPIATVRVLCEKGTYIRALARDIGTNAGTCAHITSLRRTKSGAYKIEDATPLDKISTLQELTLVLREPPTYGTTTGKQK